MNVEKGWWGWVGWGKGAVDVCSICAISNLTKADECGGRLGRGVLLKCTVFVSVLRGAC